MSKGKQWNRAAAAGLICAALLAVTPVVCRASEETVNKGIFIQGVDVGGMTREQVMQAVDEKVSQIGQTQVNLSVDGQAFSCPLNDLGLTWDNREIVNEILNLGTTGNIIQRYKDRKDLEHDSKNYYLKFKVNGEMTDSYCEGFSAYNTTPVDAVIYTRDDLTPGVDGGTPGITVDTQQAAQQLKDAVKAWDGVSAINIDVPVEKVDPDVTYDDLAIICDVLGTATTDYSASSYARATNVENGCRKISGTLLYPGDGFSVTAAVTPFTAENGYQEAPTYEENRVVNSYGGGICQVSTTLYNAVLKAELEVTARSNHTMVVTYVPLSKDAAIAEGNMDMCFVNTKDDPIYIIGYCYGGTITFTIYGHETRPSNRTIEFESKTTSTIEPTSAKFIPNSSQPVGYFYQTQSPHTGYTAELWKHIYYDGVYSESVQINSSTYTAVGTIYDVGTASDSPAVSQAMQAAIAAGSLSQIQATIANAAELAKQGQSESDAAVQPQTNQYGDVDEVVIN